YIMECSICGAPPSGVHYGATTCEACKAFFKRTVHSCLTYSCIRPGNPGQCPVHGNRRRQCAACRWRRCLTVGMRPELIRSSGTAAADASATANPQPLEQPQPVQEDQSLGFLNHDPKLADTGVRHTQLLRTGAGSRSRLLLIGQLQRAAPLHEWLEAVMIALVVGLKPHVLVVSFVSISLRALKLLVDEPPTLQKPFLNILDVLQSIRSAAVGLFQPLVEPRHQLKADSPLLYRLQQLDSPLDQLPPPSEPVETQPPLSSEEITAGVSQANENLVQNLVSFAKGLPEFSSLPMSDKKLLLQHHWLGLNVWEISNNSVPYNGYIRFSDTFRLHESHSSQHSRSFSSRAGQQMRTFIRRLTSLQVTRLEFLLLKAIFLLDADAQTEWSNREAIDAAQNCYLVELAKVCGDPTRKSTLLMLFGTLSAMKIHSVGFWASVIERTKYLPQPLLSEMLEFSLKPQESDLL
uniref:Nuclear receptor domain-containing protein n=1 Tax=Macrostomum lignano TaxID=282301 RepID=A0A1I8HE76_9PLAT